MRESATVSFSAWGHPAIRATHRGTLEVTLDADITARATCVVGVAAQVEARDLGGFGGPLTITLRCGPHEQAVRATAHAGFRLGRTLVVRCSRHLDADTFATGADLDARTLPRELVDELLDPAARLVVTVRGLRAPDAARGGTLLLAAAPGGDAGSLPSRLREGLGAADLVLGDGAVQGAERAVAALRAGGRVGLLLQGAVTTGHLARRVAAAAVDMGLAVDPGNLPPEVAALVLAGFDPDLPVWTARLAGRRTVDRGVLDGVLQGAVCVWSVPATSLAAVLGDVQARLGDVQVCAFLDAARPAETIVRGTASGVRALVGDGAARGADSLVVVAGGGGRPGPAQALLLGALLREGVPHLSIARAASTAWGWTRREAYAAIQRLKEG